ncbi:MAG: hypothetical protein JJU36_01010 [Phycisphaeraceae bacterium]|nr:hypothetical protein [Phycisphaeraceae bacterium]
MGCPAPRLIACLLGLSMTLALAAHPAAGDRAALEEPEDRQPAATETEAAQAPTSQSDRSDPDLLTGVVEPLDMLGERQRFLRAAGRGLELTEEAFNLDRRREDGFVRTFDSWEGMLRFDRDGNGRIDWFEAQAYRHDLRRRVLERFDDNRDGRLTGDERRRALAALARGPLSEARPAGGRPARPGAQRPRPGAAGAPESPEMFDLEGDAPLSEEEAEEARQAMRQQFEQDMLDRYDLDGDGVLDEEERRLMREDMRDQRRVWQRMQERWRTRHFETDEDGNLTERGREELAEFEQQLQSVGRRLEVRLFDTTGDGQVSEEERRAGRLRYAPAFLSIAQQVRQWSDLDGDGVVSAEEARAFNRHMAEAVGGWFDQMSEQFDVDGDGRLDAEERAAMVQAFSADLNRRLSEAAQDRRGRVTPAGLRLVMMDYFHEIGIAPEEKEAESAHPMP